MAYGALSTLASITDAAGNTTQYNYDAKGNLLDITYPDGTSQSFSYDPLGNLSETVLQNGDPIGYQYNSQGLVTQENFADGTFQTFGYDSHGNLTSAQSYDATHTLTGTTTLQYNAANELTYVSYPGSLSLAFAYNAQGQRTQSVDQSGYTVNYSYDSLGRLSALTDGSGNLIVQYTYNDLGQLTEKLNGNGTYTTYTYDAAGNLLTIFNYAPHGTVNSSFTYTYNALDEVTSVTDDAGASTSYTYDAIGELTGVLLPAGQTITYSYNAAGDRTGVTVNGAQTVSTSNTDNEITTVGSTTYYYDANGNLSAVTDTTGTTAYTYNDQNQLVSITTPDGTTTSFQYSPLGFIAGSTTSNGSTSSQTNYLVDPTGLGNMVGSYTGNGSLVADYNYGLGLVSQTGPSGTGYYDFDLTGNTIGITGSSGTYVNQYSYLPFGETTTVAATLPNPFTFVGQFGVTQLGSNLFNMRARNYTPATGQFLSNDPIGLAGGTSNIRQYVANDPNGFTDFTGLQAIAEDDPAPPEASWWDQWGQFWNQFQPARPIINPADQGPMPGSTPAINPADQGPMPGPTPSVGRALNGERIDLEAIKDQTGPSAPSYAGSFARAEEAADRAILRSLAPSRGKKNAPSRQSKPCPTCGGLFDCLPATGDASADTTNIDSADPNALIGPAGFGTANYIADSGTWTYTIDFANDGTAAALDVLVTEQLDANLNWSTFQLGSFGFGPITVGLPAGLTKYETTVAYQNADGTPLNVQVAIDFNVQTGLLTATYTSLDPTNGQAPLGVFDGFLPPDNAAPIGAGFVSYTIQPNSGLPPGTTTIKQQASIVFDTNAPLATNIYTNTIPSHGNPTATAAPPPLNIIPGSTSPYSFTVTYTDTVAIDTTTLGNGNVIVWNENGYYAPATLDGFSSSDGGLTVTASYHVNAPGGGWGPSDTGAYTMTMQPDQVGDINGNPVPGGTLGTFNAAVVDFAQVFSGTAPTLGSNWEVPPLLPALLYTHRLRLFDGFELQNNAAVSLAAAPVTVSQVVEPPLLNPTVEATVDASASTVQAVGVAARIQANGDAYVAALTNTGVAEILFYQAARHRYTVLESTRPGGPTSATLQFVVNDSSLSLYVNGTLMVSVTNYTALSTAGGVGLFAQGDNGIIDNFSVAGS